MNTSLHLLEIVRAPQDKLMRCAESWLRENGFRILPATDKLGLRALRGSRFGVLDGHTSRMMEVCTRSVGDFTAVSVYHHTTRILCVVGIVFTDILQAETESLLSYLRLHCNEPP